MRQMTVCTSFRVASPGCEQFVDSAAVHFEKVAEIFVATYAARDYFSLDITLSKCVVLSALTFFNAYGKNFRNCLR